MAVAMQKTQANFIEVKSIGASVFVSKTKADHAQSMDILAKNGMRPLTYQEALIHLTQNPDLKEKLKGKWFYLAGEGLQTSGYHMIDKKGNIIQTTRDEAYKNPEQTVYACPGSYPLSLLVASSAIVISRRFVLYAVLSPEVAAPMVVGIKQDGSNQVQGQMITEGVSAKGAFRKTSSPGDSDFSY